MSTETIGGGLYQNITGSLSGYTWVYEWQTTAETIGNQFIHVRAIDRWGNIGTATRFIELADTRNPQVKFDTPNEDTEFTIGEIIILRGTGTDAGGISDMKLGFADGWRSLRYDFEGKWTYNWDTSGYHAGEYPIILSVTDTSGNEAHDTIVITLRKPEATKPSQSLPIDGFDATLIIIALGVITTSMVIIRRRVQKNN